LRARDVEDQHLQQSETGTGEKNSVFSTREFYPNTACTGETAMIGALQIELIETLGVRHINKQHEQMPADAMSSQLEPAAAAPPAVVVVLATGAAT